MLYQLDFDKVAEAGFRTKRRPTMAVSQLEHATRPGLASSVFVLGCRCWHHGGWHLPLWDRQVRYWVGRQLFNEPPLIIVGGVEVDCGTPVVVDETEVASWMAHYSPARFTEDALRQQLAELLDGSRQFSFGKEDERLPRIAALQQLLRKEVDVL